MSAPEDKIEERINKRLEDEDMPLAEITNMVMTSEFVIDEIWLNVLLTVEA